MTNQECHDQEVFDCLPTARDIVRRTSVKRMELQEPFEKSVRGLTSLVAQRIAEAADRGDACATVSADEADKGNRAVSIGRVMGTVAKSLRQRGFTVDVDTFALDAGELPEDVQMTIRWSCATPDYRQAED